MSVISNVFKAHKAFVAYITAGDGGVETSLDAMCALAKGGVDILEVGVPFSDPVADGPVIQAAADRALQQGMTMEKVLRLVTQFKQRHDTPIVLFTYYNPLLQHGDLKIFMQSAKVAGVDGCLVVDLPLEESDCYHQACIGAGIDPIYLLSPSSTHTRVVEIVKKAQGMLYYVCRKGVTGMKADLPQGFAEKIAEIKKASSLPVIAGFGISDTDMAKAVIEVADGFVVGSYFVKAIADGMQGDALVQLAKDLDPRGK